MDEFSGPNVDAAAALVECAGRYLRRSPESRVRAENLMEVRLHSRRDVCADAVHSRRTHTKNKKLLEAYLHSRRDFCADAVHSRITSTKKLETDGGAPTFTPQCLCKCSAFAHNKHKII